MTNMNIWRTALSQLELEHEFDRLMREETPQKFIVMVMDSNGELVPGKPPTLTQQRERARNRIELVLAERQSQLDAEQDERAEQELITQLRCMRDQETITDWQRELLNEYESERLEEWLQ